MKKNTDPIIDFGELAHLSRGNRGEGLEGLVRVMSKKLKLDASWTGRGSDGGRDLIISEKLIGVIASETKRWLVMCRDQSESGKSVLEKDLPSIADKLTEHNCDAFLLVTTTTPSSAAKKKLDSYCANGKSNAECWDRIFLEQFLLDDKNRDILKQFFPNSYSQIMKLTTIEGALLNYRHLFPDSIFKSVTDIIKPYSEGQMKGTVLFPQDQESANIADQAMEIFLKSADLCQFSVAVMKLSVDSFFVFFKSFSDLYETANELLYEILISDSASSELRLACLRLYQDNDELSAEDYISCLCRMEQPELGMLLDDEIAISVADQLISNEGDFELYESIADLASVALVNYVEVINTSYSADDSSNSIVFTSEIEASIQLIYENESIGLLHFPGEISGHMDAYSLYITEAKLDVSSYYE